MGKMKDKAIQRDNQQFCEACEFVRLLAPHGGGYCRTHGTIKPARTHAATPLELPGKTDGIY